MLLNEQNSLETNLRSHDGEIRGDERRRGPSLAQCEGVKAREANP